MRTSSSPRPTLEVEHVIVGAGQAAGVLFRKLPSSERVVLIEGALVGGSCVNYGCTPTKTLVASAKVAHQARRARDYGVGVGSVTIDYAAIRERMNAMRHGMREGLEQGLATAPNVTLLRGWASFVDERTLQVGDTLIRAQHVYLDTGSRARTPDIEGLSTVPWLDNVRLLDVEELPEHLLVIGASYIGLEFAQVYRRFGARVTVVDANSLMPREDRDVADAAQQILAGEGIDFHLGIEVRRVRPADGGGIRLTIAEDGRERDIVGSHLLVAAGRVPNVERLDLPKGGVETDGRGFIRVDDELRTSAEGVFALGDVNGRSAFTHTSVNDAEIVLDVLNGGPRRLSDRITVYAMFIDPPLGRVGLTEREAKERGHRLKRGTMPMSSITRAKEMGETEGFVKLLVDADSDHILGASILGVHGDEVINMLAAFMYGDRTCTRYRQAVLVHPTVGELMPWVLDALEPVEETVAAS
jgi:pyruvate/2-oxoglutarate dehydrogenase complex dihydrolipoamide dehydrogenase (E3) component